MAELPQSAVAELYVKQQVALMMALYLESVLHEDVAASRVCRLSVRLSVALQLYEPRSLSACAYGVGRAAPTRS